jgi:hypothetical protein
MIIFSCSKNHWTQKDIPKHCELCIMLSDKYNLIDTSFIRTDTLDKSYLCDSTLNVYKLEASRQEKTFTLCGLNMIEKRRFIYKP